MPGKFCAGKAEVDMKRQTQGHDMRIVITEFQGRGILWQGR